ncbi:MAG: hypothetical protein WBV93_20070 [Anaerobacillus sp.]
MWLAETIGPLVLMGVIVVVVIGRLKRKSDKGNLGKKHSKAAQTLLDSLIPLGMLLGTAIGVMVGMVFSISFLFSVNVGAALGYLVGYFAYEIYSKQGNDYP